VVKEETKAEQVLATVVASKESPATTTTEAAKAIPEKTSAKPKALKKPAVAKAEPAVALAVKAKPEKKAPLKPPVAMQAATLAGKAKATKKPTAAKAETAAATDEKAKAEKTAAGKSASGKASVPAKEAKAKKQAAPKKAKLVRDSFTIPETDYVLFASMKQRALAAGSEIKKSELLRASLAVLNALQDADFAKAIGAVERIKTGRPKK
jgi:hypothetical protein